MKDDDPENRQCGRSHGSSRVIEQGRRWMIASLVLLPALAETKSRAADDYFEGAIAKAERTLTRPAESYGLVLMDTVSITEKRGRTPRVVRERYSFYTRDGKVRYEVARYDPGKPDGDLDSSILFVSQGEGRDAREVSSNSRRTALTLNAKHPVCMVGLEEKYWFHSSEAKNVAEPETQPFQILVNPCFAPLSLTLAELRALPVNKLPEQEGLKVYEVKKRKKGEVVLLYFDPRHGDAISRSELRFAGEGAGRDAEFSESWVRAVEGWQDLPGGISVPARFVMKQERPGWTYVSFVREISDPLIGEVPEAMFDVSRLPRFQGRVDVIVDGEKERHRDPRGFITSPRIRSNSSVVLLFVANAVALAAVAIFFALRRWRRKMAS